MRVPVRTSAADPRPIVAAEVTFPSAAGLPPLLEGRLEVAGITVAGPVFTDTAVSDPRNDPGWTWTTAVWNAQSSANDEFKQTLTVDASGTYSYAYRFSDDAQYNFMYCDFDPGTADGFSVLDLGVLTVE